MKIWIFITIILIKPVFVASMLHSLCNQKWIFAFFPRTAHMLDLSLSLPCEILCMKSVFGAC